MPRRLRKQASLYGGVNHEDLQQADPDEARCPEASHLQQPLSISLVAEYDCVWRLILSSAGSTSSKTTSTLERCNTALARLPAAGQAGP